MKPQSIVRFRDAKGQTVGMGVVVAPRRVVTLDYVIRAALGRRQLALDEKGNPPRSISMATQEVSFELPFSSSTAVISSRVVGWHRYFNDPGPSRIGSLHIVVLETSSEAEDFLSPAPLISARDTNFYFDRRFRILGFGDSGDVYISGTLEGLLPNGLVQLRVGIPWNDVGGSGASPVWDLETGGVLGVFSHMSSLGFMASTQTIAAAWPDLEVGFGKGWHGREEETKDLYLSRKRRFRRWDGYIPAS
jgi:hypothetical protein